MVDSATSSQSSNALNSTLSLIPTTIRVPTPPPTTAPAITSNLPPLFISGTTYSGLPLADGTIVEALVGGFIVGSDVVTNGKNSFTLYETDQTNSASAITFRVDGTPTLDSTAWASGAGLEASLRTTIVPKTSGGHRLFINGALVRPNQLLLPVTGGTLTVFTLPESTGLYLAGTTVTMGVTPDDPNSQFTWAGVSGQGDSQARVQINSDTYVAILISP